MQHASGPISLGQLKGRTLPLAAAKFAEHLRHALERFSGEPAGEARAA